MLSTGQANTENDLNRDLQFRYGKLPEGPEFSEEKGAFHGHKQNEYAHGCPQKYASI
jgi:hypothetical protein